MYFSNSAALLFVTAMALVGCDTLVPDVGPLIAGSCDQSDSDSGTDVSFSADVAPILAECSCHMPGDSDPIGITLGGLDLSNLSAIFAGGNVSGSNNVIPGDPCASVLPQKVSAAPPFGSRMPLTGPPFLTIAERQAIHDWIAEGAKDN